MTDRPVTVLHRHAPLDSAKPLNPRQELFAQGMARGMTHADAYRDAGYKSQTNTFRMCKFPNVQARIKQLMAEAAARHHVTTDQITAYLLDLIARSDAGDTAPLMQLNRAAVMDLAKIHGLLDAKGQPKAGAQICTCGGANRITEIRRVLVYPDGREEEYGK
jgi:hypothetical protein